jgi:hypothetical protein
MRLLDGVRQGVDLGILLGYQFERGLHDSYQQVAELDAAIYAFREQFPGASAVDANTVLPALQATQQVVNGLSLLKAVRKALAQAKVLNTEDTLFAVLRNNPALRPFGLGSALSAAIQGDSLLAIYKEIDRLADAFDALSDLLLAESVYQTARGNHARSALTVEALSECKNPPEPEIVSPPRSGSVVTQRLVLNLAPVDGRTLFPGSGLSTAEAERNRQAAKPAGWGDLTLRALAEPSLNRWLGERLGDPDEVRCWAEYPWEEGTASLPVSLKDLNLQPLDAVTIMGAASSENASELNRRIARFVRQTKGLGADVKVTVTVRERSTKLLRPTESLTPEIKTFYEIAPLMRALADVCNTGKAATSEDLSLPGDGSNGDTKHQNGDELLARLQALKSTVEQACRDWLALLPGAIPGGQPLLTELKPEDYFIAADFVQDNPGALVPKAGALRTFLETAAWVGVAFVYPETDANDDTTLAALSQAGNTAFKVLINRLKQVDPLLQKGDVASRQQSARDLLGGCPILPHFSLKNPKQFAAMLAQADRWLAQMATQRGPFPMDTWLQGTAKTRKRVAGLEMVLALSDVLGCRPPELTPGQLPCAADDYWVGAAYPETFQPPRHTLSLVMAGPPADPSADQCGLVLDEWTEVIPGREEMTGITFNYNQPNATAPQSLLLAVTPHRTGQWQWDDLVYTLLDTLDLAKLRAVEPDHLDKSLLAQFLPGVLGENVGAGQVAASVNVLTNFEINTPYAKAKEGDHQ